MRQRSFAAWGLAILFASATLQAQQEVILTIQVQGNTLTPDEDVIRAAGLSEGSPFSDGLLADAADRLMATKRFEHVDVLKRYGSIVDPTQIVVLIRVEEGPVKVVQAASPGQAPRVVRRSTINVMFVPILDAEDGYGFTYGAQLAVTGHQSASSRVVFPLSWGGDKRASAEFQKEFSSPLVPSIRTGALVQRRTHPLFRSDADRTRAWARAEWSLFKLARIGTTTAWQKTTLLDRTDTSRSVGIDVVLDTRLDPLLPRNAVLVKGSVDRRRFSSVWLTETSLEANGYLGLYRGNVLALRGLRHTIGGSAPLYDKPLLGGAGNLRGFRAGTAIGDTLVAGSAELKMPLTSPLNIARLGASIFVDIGTAYHSGEHLRDQRMRRGVGAGVWATAALFHLNLAVARGAGAGTRVHFAAGLTF